MKIICLRENLKKNLNIAEKIIGRNLTLPILNNFLLATDKGRLKVSSTNLETGINTWTAGKVSDEGSVCVPAKTLTNLINNLSEEKISLETKKTALFIKTEKYKATINGFDPKDFPIIPKIKEDKNVFSLNAAVLREALVKTAFAAAVSDFRPEISGVFAELTDGALTLAATDSFRLAEKIIKIKDLKGTEALFIIPLKTIQEVVKILSDQKEGAAKIVFSKNQVLFETESVQLISRLVEGSFPNYRQIIPKQFKTTAELDKNETSAAVKLTSVLSGKLNDVKFAVNPGKKQIEITAKDAELGENQSVLEGKISGEPLEIVFNHNYLSDGFNNIAGDKIFVGFNGPTNPVLVKSPAETDYLYIVMPIKPF